jgi:FixJ family two-component response regulator
MIRAGTMTPGSEALAWWVAMGTYQNILVVEDDASMRRAVARFLYAAGFFPIAYESAEAFLEDKLLAGVACLVVDVQLPGISGLELAEQLVQTARPIPIVFISAHDEPMLRERASSLGYSEYLLKPFDGKQLVDAIGRLAGPH